MGDSAFVTDESLDAFGVDLLGQKGLYRAFFFEMEEAAVGLRLIFYDGDILQNQAVYRGIYNDIVRIHRVVSMFYDGHILQGNGTQGLAANEFNVRMILLDGVERQAEFQ